MFIFFANVISAFLYFKTGANEKKDIRIKSSTDSAGIHVLSFRWREASDWYVQQFG